jgi:hypothetical protein
MVAGGVGSYRRSGDGIGDSAVRPTVVTRGGISPFPFHAISHSLLKGFFLQLPRDSSLSRVGSLFTSSIF